MNHFNATVKDGKLINTRRGLQVSRQKFNGISFVNSCPQASTPSTQAKFPQASGSSSQRTITFVESEEEPSRRTPRVEQWRGTLEVPGRRKQRRKAASKDPSSGESSRGSSRAPSTSSTDYLSSLTPVVRLDGRPSPAHDFSFRLPLAMLESPKTTPGKPREVSAEDWDLFRVYWERVPRKIYPYEDIMTYNPSRAHEFYSSMLEVGGTSSVHCVLMSGCISQAVLSAEIDSKGYAYHISKMCAILNRALDEGKPVNAATLGCISTLAANGVRLVQFSRYPPHDRDADTIFNLSSVLYVKFPLLHPQLVDGGYLGAPGERLFTRYVGRLGDWWMHILGLQQILKLRDHVDLSHPLTGSQLHKADLKGSMTLATAPLFPFTRSYPPISAILSSTIRSYIQSSLCFLLESVLPLSSPVAGSITSLALFVASIRLANQSGGAIRYDPFALTDEWLSIMNDLLANPLPLRETKTGENPFVGGRNNDVLIVRTVDYYMANQRLHKDAHIVPSPGTNSWEAALRIAGLLYIKELFADWPRNIGGYAVLLALLQQHMEIIIRETFVDVNIDPALGNGRERADKSNIWVPETASQRRAVLIFLCLFGSTACLTANENEGRYEKGDVYSREIYQRGLRLALGLSGETSMRGYLPVKDEDLLLLKVLDMRNIKGEAWDDKSELEKLLREDL
ncbi:hypothetical protein QBC34DRAFT_381141 [Podospora aff. communis PSN243]|uniref:Uncharacterized protein n=1 Tax=Podospora aff. communis PSN243 TaxID=3040156 RepID=A0AAV9GM94_9PEZI|nr:hypothetical protein QBC34DRAFT_381141 [Podospora aff. communis PSN243]